MNPTNELVQSLLILKQQEYGESISAGVAIDPQTEIIYISSWKGCRIIIFNKELEEQRFPKNKFIVKYPRGLRFKHRMLYVAESDRNTNHSCIKVFQRDGTLFQEFGSWGAHNSQLQLPLALDVDIHKNLYILNSSDGKIKLFSKEGKFISKFGRQELSWPIDIRIYKTLIYVLGHRIPLMFVFDYEQNFVTVFTLPFKGESSYFAINSSGELIFSVRQSVNIVVVNEHSYATLESPHHSNEADRKGIEMDNKENLVTVFCTRKGSFIQVIQDP